MDFDSFENLSDRDITELYDDITMESDDSMISYCNCIDSEGLFYHTSPTCWGGLTYQQNCIDMCNNIGLCVHWYSNRCTCGEPIHGDVPWNRCPDTPESPAYITFRPRRANEPDVRFTIKHCPE